MPGTIVVGFDGSDHAVDALALGRLLARATGAELLVVCAYPDDPLGESATAVEIAGEMRTDAEAHLSRAREIVAGAGERAELRAVAGASPSHVLHDLAEELGARAIVVGPTHHGTVLRRITGSTPEHVLDHAPCPVAVAPDGFAAREAGTGALRRVAVAYDGGDEAGHALAAAAELARAAGARVRLVTVVNSAAVGMYPPLDVSSYEQLAELARREAQGRLAAAVAEADLDGVEVETAVLDGDVDVALVEDSREDDLLFAGSRGHGPFRRVLLGSVSRHLLRESACPVVIVPRGGGGERSETP